MFLRSALTKGSANDGKFFELAENEGPLDVTELTVKIFHAGDPVGYCVSPLPPTVANASSPPQPASGAGLSDHCSVGMPPGERQCCICQQWIEDNCEGLVSTCASSHSFHYTCIHSGLLALPVRDVVLASESSLCPACGADLLDPVLCPASACVVCTDCWMSTVMTTNENADSLWRKRSCHSVKCKCCLATVKHSHALIPVRVVPTEAGQRRIVRTHYTTGFAPLDYGLTRLPGEKVVVTNQDGTVSGQNALFLLKLSYRQDFLRFLQRLPRNERQLQPSSARPTNVPDADDPQMVGHCPACPATDGMCQFTYLPPLQVQHSRALDMRRRMEKLLFSLRATDVGLCLPLSKEVEAERRMAGDIDTREAMDAGSIFLSTVNSNLRLLDGRHISDQALSLVACWWMARVHGREAFVYYANASCFRWYFVCAVGDAVPNAQNMCNIAHLCSAVRATILAEAEQCSDQWLNFVAALSAQTGLSAEERSHWPETIEDVLSLVTSICQIDGTSMLNRLRRTHQFGTLVVDLGPGTAPLCGRVDGMEVHVFPDGDVDRLMQMLLHPMSLAEEVGTVAFASRYGSSSLARGQNTRIQCVSRESMSTTTEHLFRKIATLCCSLLQKELGPSTVRIANELVNLQFNRGGSTYRAPLQLDNSACRCPCCRSQWRSTGHTLFLEWTMFCSVHLVCKTVGFRGDRVTCRRQLLHADCMPFSIAGLFSHSMAKDLLTSYSIYPNLPSFNRCLQALMETPGQVSVIKSGKGPVQFYLEVSPPVSMSDVAMNIRLAPRTERNGDVIRSLVHNILLERTLRKGSALVRTTCLLPCAVPSALTEADVELGLATVYAFLNICHTFCTPEARDVDDVTERNIGRHAGWLASWLIGGMLTTNGGCKKIPVITGPRNTFKTGMFKFWRSILPRRTHFLALEQFLQTDKNPYSAISDQVVSDLKFGHVGLICFDETSKTSGSECGGVLMQQLKAIAGQVGPVRPTLNVKKGSAVTVDLTSVSMVIVANDRLPELEDSDGKRTPTFRTGKAFLSKEEVLKLRREVSAGGCTGEIPWLAKLCSTSRSGDVQAGEAADNVCAAHRSHDFDWSAERSASCVVSYLPEVLERFSESMKEDHLIRIVRLFLLQLMDDWDETYTPPRTHLPLVISDSYGTQILPHILSSKPTRCLSLFQGKADVVNDRMGQLRGRLHAVKMVALRVYLPGERIYSRLSEEHVVPVYVGQKRIHCVVCPASHESLPNLTSPWTDIYDLIVRCYRDRLSKQNENSLNWLTVLDVVEACMTKALAKFHGHTIDTMPDLQLLNNLLVYSSTQSLVFWPETDITSRAIYEFWIQNVPDFCSTGAQLWRKRSILCL